MPPPKRHSFNVMLSANDYACLLELAQELDIPKSQVIRRAVLNFHQMRIAQIPCCATGQQCLVPHMHPPRPNSAAAPTNSTN